MIKYEIEGGNLPVVICYPEAGQTLCTESGAMSWMSPNMQMETNAGGGLKKALGRIFSGESIFLNEYTAVGGSGLIAFASGFPGSIIPCEVTPGNGIIVQKKGFLAMEKGLYCPCISRKSWARVSLAAKALSCSGSPAEVWCFWKSTAIAKSTI